MKRGVAITVLLVAVAVIAMACGGGNGSGSADGGNGNDATATTARSTPTMAMDTFAQLRDALRNRLHGIGVNIGSVPDDVLNQILNQCHELEKFADQQRVNDLCDAIRRARDTNDVGLIDQIATQLRQLPRK